MFAIGIDLNVSPGNTGRGSLVCLVALIAFLVPSAGTPAQSAVDLGQRELRLGKISYEKPTNKSGSNITLLRSADPAVAAVRGCGKNKVQLVPQSIGETKIEFWDESEQKLYLVAVKVIERDPEDSPYVGIINFEGGSKLVQKNYSGELILQSIETDAGDLFIMVVRFGRKPYNELKFFDHEQTADDGGAVMYHVLYDANGSVTRTEVDRGKGWQQITSREDLARLARFKQFEEINGDFDLCPGDPGFNAGVTSRAGLTFTPALRLPRANAGGSRPSKRLLTEQATTEKMMTYADLFWSEYDRAFHTYHRDLLNKSISIILRHALLEHMRYL